MNSANILPHKVLLSAKFSPGRTVLVLELFLSDSLGIETSDFLTLTWDLSPAGGSGLMQFFVTD